MKTVSKKFQIANKDAVSDIIIFGSTMKGKMGRDLDIALITKCPKEDSITLASDFQKTVGDNVHVSYAIIDELFSKGEPIWLSMLHEATSLVYDEPLQDRLHLKSYFLFTYDSSVLIYKDKIRFYFAFKGRDGKSGILKTIDGKMLSKGVFLTNIEYETEATSFFLSWKMPFSKKRIFLEE